MFTGRGRQLTIYFGESDLYQHQALYMAIVQMLRREGLSGVTVTRGMAGFGMSSVIHTSAILRLSMDLPVRSSSCCSTRTLQRCRCLMTSATWSGE